MMPYRRYASSSALSPPSPSSLHSHCSASAVLLRVRGYPLLTPERSDPLVAMAAADSPVAMREQLTAVLASST